MTPNDGPSPALVAIAKLAIATGQPFEWLIEQPDIIIEALTTAYNELNGRKR